MSLINVPLPQTNSAPAFRRMEAFPLGLSARSGETSACRPERAGRPGGLGRCFDGAGRGAAGLTEFAGVSVGVWLGGVVWVTSLAEPRRQDP